MSTTKLRPINSLAIALDPALLMAELALPPDPWQRDALRSESKRMLLLASRQSGKSTTTACLALHTALYRCNSLILLFAPSQRQSTELFRKVLAFYYALGRPVRATREMATSLELVNGSRIVSLPGDPVTVRCYSGVWMAIVDEAALVIDGLFAAVMPMLAVSRGRMICLSTPFGRRGWFHEAWESTGTWHRIKAKATECPRIDPEFLEEQRGLLGPRYYCQEYECEFVEAIDQVFSTESILAMFDSDVPALAGV
ncbi:MAG TPA: terminase family protein [Chloroflexota bacterium]|jgi:hypothetical protein|nr:terminase family protein [Chloroflexota bacterium]